MNSLRSLLLGFLAVLLLSSPLIADTVPNTSMHDPINGVIFNGALYFFHTHWTQSTDTTETYYTSTYGSTWSPRLQAPLPTGYQTGQQAVVFNGRLYLFWHGLEDDKRVSYISMDEFGVWDAVVRRIPNAFASAEIALAAFNGRLYAMWRATSDNTSLFYASMSSSGTWGNTAHLSTGESSLGPSAAVVRMADGVDYLYAFWKDRNFGADPMWYARMPTGGSWSATTKLNTPDYPLTNLQPIVVADDMGLSLFYKGGYSDSIYRKRLTAAGAWLPEGTIGGSAVNGPVVTYFNGAAWVFDLSPSSPPFEIRYGLFY